MVKNRVTGYLVQDVGLVLLLACIFIGALTVGNTPGEFFLESIIMLLGSFLAILLAGYKLTSLSVVVAGFEILVYTAYRLYLSYTVYEAIPWTSYVWLILPIASVGAMFMFITGSHQTEMENDVLKEQVEELVMINSLTGLYNLRSLYNDLQKQAAYTARNNMILSLMIVELRYEQELRSVLSRSHYESMIQKLALLVSDAVRVEDRTYSLDNKGTIGVILTCDKVGSSFVEKRIKSRIADPEAFAGITDGSIKVEVRVACLEYDKEEFGDDMISFKQKVESELQYDV